MSSRRSFDHWIDVVFLFIVLISIISAVTFLNSEDVFDAKITYINDVKMPYSVYILLENKVDTSLKYDVDVIYKRNNLVVASDIVKCEDECEIKLELKKVFFDKYDIEIVVKYRGSNYKKRLKFDLSKKKESSNSVIIDKIYHFNEKEKGVIVEGQLILENSSKVIIETYPLINDELRQKYEFDCEKNCNFSFKIEKNILFGKYKLDIYLPTDVLTDEYEIDYLMNNDNITFYNEANMFMNIVKLNLTNDTDLIVVDMFGNKKKISLNELNSTYGYNVFINNKSLNKSSMIIKPFIHNIENLNNMNFNENDTVIINSKFGFVEMQKAKFSLQSNLANLNPVVYDEEKIMYKNGISIVDDSLYINNSEELRKVLPGIYKKERIIRYKDGTENVIENFFAYGLVSINTKKPLYHKDEKVDLLIVILDKYGYLVSDANIVLNVTTPFRNNMIFSTKNLDIIETDKAGVYNLSFVAEELGQYNLYSQVDLDNMIVDVDSYFNVVENYEFDILRDVPATIDPWEGPFRNDFSVIPLNGYSDRYVFTEVFSSDFDIINTSADEVKVVGDTTYLIWNNLVGSQNSMYYVVQVPLKTPYLYYLGKSYIDYNGKNNIFYENRSWLFAIDPAAKECGINSPCICGAACASGNEPGDATIDTCSDGNTNWEFVNDIRVTDLNGSYFGTGDTVEFCVDFQCDSSFSGDRISKGYKDATGGWVNGNVVYDAQCDNNNLNTICQNQILNNYVGVHNFRGKIVWEFASSPANDICDQPLYYDHDDINITVLERRAAYYTLWNFSNGTSIGDGLRVIRGYNITVFAKWDKYIQDAVVRHNGNLSFVDYMILDFTGNYTNYTADTSDLVEFSSLGVVNVSYINSYDLYFNLSNKTSPSLYFEIFGLLKFNQSKMEPYIMYNGSQTNISCQVVDEMVGVSYSGVNVSFYHNVSGFLGSALSDSFGWANISFVENISGEYAITCNFTDQLSDYYIAGGSNEVVQILTVKENGSDILPPVINGISSVPSLFSIGGVTTIKSNVTDNINLVDVYINITVPGGVSYLFNMTNTVDDWYEYNFSLTSVDGIYEYFIEAYDNSSNKAWSSTKYFSVVGIRTYVGIETQKNIYKIGEVINLTTYSKVSIINNSVFYEEGDSDSIFYSFDLSDEGWTHSGAQDEWERGVPSDSDVNVCESSNCWCTDLNANYNNNANNNIQSPVIDMSGRNNAKVIFWREIDFNNPSADNIYFESFDGIGWNILYQNTIGAGNQEGSFYTYYPSEVDGVSNTRFRFRSVTDWSGTQDGFAFDTFNLSFTPKIDWDKSWFYYNNSFGVDNNKTTAIYIGINITDYSSFGSDTGSTNGPDLEVQIYNGVGYTGGYKCNLDSTKSYPYLCEFVIKNTPEYLDAWKTSVNRYIRVRTIDIDSGDFINWSNIKREYVLPSIIENHGVAQVTSYLLEQFKNSTGGVVQTMYNSPIELNASNAKQLNSYWSFSVPGGFQLGNYSAYIALVDAFGNVLQNEDDNTFINDSYVFEVASLIVNPQNPLESSIQKESFFSNLTLDVSSYGSGGWCNYSLDSIVNVSMIEKTIINFDKLLVNITDGVHTIKFYCNDTDNFMVESALINFNVSQIPRIDYVFPTDINDSFVNRSWIYINVSINDSSFNSSWLEWNGIDENVDGCDFIGGIEWSCFVNKTGLKNSIYNYRVCANDSIGNINCTGIRSININKSLPLISIILPFNNSKFSILDIINMNVSLSVDYSFIDKVWFGLNDLGINYSMNNYSLYNWGSNISLSTGFYNITFFANDTVGNVFNSFVYYFTVIPDKDIYVEKDIFSLGNDSYQVIINVTNLGRWNDYILYDFVDSNFTYYDFVVMYQSTNVVSGVYIGDILRWNFSIGTLNSTVFSYKVNGTDNFDMKNNYITGIE